MKKIIIPVIIAMLGFCVLSACVEDNEDNPNIVTVKFNTDGGSKIPNVKIPKGSNLQAEGKVPSNPVKDGFDFSGWYDISDPYEAIWWMGKAIEKDLTLKTIWTPIDPNRGNIYFDPENGGNTITRLCNVGEVIPDFPIDPVWIGYIFQGWFDDNDAQYKDDTIVTVVRITLKAKWIEDPDIRRVTVQFNANGGNPSSIPSVSIPEGSSLGSKLPANPVKAEWTFAGWRYDHFRYVSSTPVYEDMTLTAEWVQFGYQGDDGSWLIDHSKFFVYFGANFNDGDTINFTQQHGGVKIPISDFGDNIADYRQLVIFFTLIPFINSQTGLPASPPFEATVAGLGPDTEEWGRDVFYPQFNTGGNTVLVVNTSYFNTLMNIPDVFNLMIKQNSASGFSMKISSMKLVGTTLPQVTAVFDPCNGNPVISRSVTAGNTIGASNFPPNPTRDGYIFVRWYDSITRSTIANNTIIGNMTVKAEWRLP